jgi:hypothetical protein
MIRILSPVGRQQRGFSPLAARPHSLSGRKVGLLWNGKPNGDVYLEEFREVVGAQDSGVEFELFVKRGATDEPDAQMVSRLRQCDVVVTAVGD